MSAWSAAPGPAFYDFGSLATDGTNVYVVRGFAWVERYDLNGRFLGRWGPTGTAEVRFVNVGAVAVDVRGDVFVADTTDPGGAVYKFSPSGQPLAKWPLRNPEGVVPASDGTFLVSYAGGVERRSATGQRLSGWFTEGTARELAVGPDGDVYVAIGLQYGVGVVVRYDSRGRVIARWGDRGVNGYPGRTWGRFGRDGPRDIALDAEGSVWASDDSGRVQRFSATGVFEGVCGPVSGMLGAPRGLATVDTDLLVASGERIERIGETSAPAPPCFPEIPRISVARVTPNRFSLRPGSPGTTFSFRSSETGVATIDLSRRASVRCARRPGRCWRYVNVRTLTSRVRKGPNEVRFSGRIRGRAIPRATYRAIVTVSAQGMYSKPTGMRFWVV